MVGVGSWAQDQDRRGRVDRGNKSRNGRGRHRHPRGPGLLSGRADVRRYGLLDGAEGPDADANTGSTRGWSSQSISGAAHRDAPMFRDQDRGSLTLPEELQGPVATASLAFVPTTGSGASRTFVSVFAVVR